MAIETSFPCIPHIKKVQEEGWDTYSKGCLCDGKVLICGGGVLIQGKRIIYVKRKTFSHYCIDLDVWWFP